MFFNTVRKCILISSCFQDWCLRLLLWPFFGVVFPHRNLSSNLRNSFCYSWRTHFTAEDSLKHCSSLNTVAEAGAPLTWDVPHIQAVMMGFLWFSSLPPSKWWANTSDHLHFHPNPFHCIIHRSCHSVHSDSINCKTSVLPCHNIVFFVWFILPWRWLVIILCCKIFVPVHRNAYAAHIGCVGPLRYPSDKNVT